MLATVEKAASLLGVPLVAPDGTERVTGHSLRCTGAHGLASLGWHLWTVQMMGRWESDVVKGYLGDAPLSVAQVNCRRLQDGVTGDFASLVEEVRRSMGSSSSSDPPINEGRQARTTTEGSTELAPQDLLHEAITEAKELIAAEAAREGFDLSDLVVNLRGHKFHRIKSAERAICGWQYSQPGAQSSFVLLESEGPQVHGDLCEKCFAAVIPGLHLALLDEPVRRSSENTVIADP